MVYIRSLKLLAFLIFVAISIDGCINGGPEIPKEMPKDFAFSVSFGVGSKNKIDTFNGVFIKDLVSAGTANAELTFTNTEMNSIYEKMLEINILQPMDLIGDTNCFRQPYGEDKWLIRVNGHEKTIEWSGQYCEETKDAKKLAELRIFIFEIVKGKDGYKKLPEPVGGYD